MKSLLIIGGTGFFGKSILDYFQRDGLKRWDIESVIVMSRNAEILRTQSPELLSNNVELLSADITKANAIPNTDYIIHAAASTDASLYLSRPKQERENILSATVNFNRIVAQSHENSKIVYISSGAVYGQQTHTQSFLDETSDFNPIDKLPFEKRDYAAAKRDSEFLIKKLGFERDIKVSIARCFSFLGYYLPRNKHFAIGNFIGNGINKANIVVKSNHCVYRSYMYADDLVCWLMTIADNANSTCPVYNVGSNEAIQIRDLAKLIAHRFKVQAIMSGEISTNLVDYYIPSINKAIIELDLKIRYDLSSAIDLVIQSINHKL